MPNLCLILGICVKWVVNIYSPNLSETRNLDIHLTLGKGVKMLTKYLRMLLVTCYGVKDGVHPNCTFGNSARID